MMHTSHVRGENGFGPVNRRHIFSGLRKSTMTNAAATQMHTVDMMTAGSATFLKRSMPNTWAELATIRPPADRPTKVMKATM